MIDKRSGARMAAGLATDKWKRSLGDYVDSARALALSIERYGFFDTHAIPIDPNGELLDGSHRLACALALGIEAVTVTRQPQLAWAPAWGEQWFVEKGCPAEDLERIRSDFAALVSPYRTTPRSE